MMVHKNSLCLILISFFVLAPLVKATTGDVIAQYPAPGSCPTGLTFDGKMLWLADRKSDLLYRIDPDNGAVRRSLEAPGYQVEGLAMEDEFLWALDVEENVILKLNLKTEIIEKTLYVPCDNPNGLAWDGKYLWVADYRQDMLFQISTEDGTTITQLPSPAGNPHGLCFDGKYLWVSDRIDNMIYMVHPENGNVIVAFASPSEFPRGLAWDGTSLWNVDYQTDSLYQLLVHDNVTYSRGEGKKQQLEYTHQFRNYGPGRITSLDIYLAVPHNLPFQQLLDTIRYYPVPTDFVTDRWDQKIAHYHFDGVPAGGVATVSMQVTAELFKTRFFVFPEKAGELGDIPEDTAAKYLIDDTKYWVDDPFIRETSQNVVGDEDNCYWIARKLFNYLIDNMHYERVGGWNVAPTVLKRGSGSCSEYSFVYIALCRAAGLPARYAGSVVIRGDDASTDNVFHRWVEVFLPNYGWIPVDPSGGDEDSPARQASAIGYLTNRFLITTIGGGRSEYLEWGYNSNEFWQSTGKCKIFVEHIGEWSPLAEPAGSE
ncbi:MAG: transglutaminase [Candidatus Zixiibacteriota bacterium]|nr:MAG: transglutaminase [candidate division Zixibacteria bacterium]